MKCKCGKRVTQVWPTSLCDTLWGFKHLFKALLLERDLFKRDDETNENWYARCKEKALTSKMFSGKI